MSVLTRATLGKIAALSDSPISGVEDAFSTGDFGKSSGSSLGLSSGALLWTSGAAAADRSTQSIIYTPAGVLEDCMVQIVLKSQSEANAGIGAVARSDTFGQSPPRATSRAEGANKINALTAATGGTTQTTAQSAPTVDGYRISLACEGSDVAAYHFTNAIAHTLTTTQVSGYPGFYSSAGTSHSSQWRRFYVTRSRYLRVNGPVGNWRARVKDGVGSILAQADAVAGLALVDMLTVILPSATTIEIYDLDAAAVVPGSETMPSDLIWPGDVWTYSVAPDTPDAPTLIDSAPAGLTIGWSAVSGATSYKLFRASSSGGPYTEIFSGSALSFIDAPLTPETTYFYRLQACNAAGCSADSAYLEATTDEGDVAPCSLLLEVFEADGETVDWEVSTDRAHPLPYLDLPSNYGAREIDPVNGAATIATIDVSIRDVPQSPGNQQSGYVSQKLSTIYGRRCRLQRYVDDVIGYVLVADGPGGAPRLNPDYSSYSFTIRDNRETERKLTPFAQGGSTSLAPPGPIEDWGTQDGGGPLLPAAVPLVGDVVEGSFTFNGVPWTSSFVLLPYTLVPSGSTFLTVGIPDRAILDAYSGSNPDKSVLALYEPNQGTVYGDYIGWPDLDVLWRPEGSSDPFNVSRPRYPYSGVPGGFRECISIGGGRFGTTSNLRFFIAGVLLWSAPTSEGRPTGMPSPGASIEFLARYRGAPSADRPYYYEGTLGQLLSDLYDRTLEQPGATGGDVYDPLGLEPPPSDAPAIAVDSARLALLDTPVLLRQTSPITDGRDWAEKKLYAPSGWIPAFDADGRISPASRARPTAVTQPEVNASNAEPAPEWNAGERIVTEIRYSSSRYYLPDDPAIAVAKDGLAIRAVSVTYRDLQAQQRHNEQVVSYEAEAFAAVGDETGEALSPGAETVNVLASAANAEVLTRYRDGAPAIVVRVLRREFPTLREGDFVPVDLPWLPGTLARGLQWDAAQVLQIEQTSCEWITLLIESSPIATEPGYYENGAVTDDSPGPGLGEHLGDYLGGTYPEA